MPWNRKDYPDNWEEIRERILRRARNRCEECGVMNHAVINKHDRSRPSAQQWDMYNNLIMISQYSKQQARTRMGFTLIVCTIAHLDNDKDNHDVTDDRLKCLCQRCHLKQDMSHHVENRKYGRNFRKNQHKLF